MKTNKKYLFGVAVILAAITFGFIACSDDDGGGGGGPTAQELANAFKEDYADALELTVGDVDTNDEAKVKDALEAYELLKADVKAFLTEEKALLDSLKEKIDELIAAATAQELADNFKAGNADALKLTLENVNASDQEIINKALEAYELLNDAVKALLTEQKALLDSLKEKIIKEITVSTTIETVEQWNAAIAQIVSGGSGTEYTRKYYTLTIDGDFSLDPPSKTFGSVEYITVTLNGSGTISKSSSGYLLSTDSNQTLVIDSEDLILKGISSSGSSSVVNVGTNSQVELRNGTITGNRVSIEGGGVVVGGNFIMSGGNITGNEVYTTLGSTSVYGGGVYIWSGNFTMSGGNITGNKVSCTSTGSSYGGGVCINSSLTDANFTMTGGNISENETSGSTNNSSGGGVYFHSGGSFTMTGGNISNNKASTTGGGVETSRGTFNMNGGSISENTATTNGGGVYNYTTFNMNGGIISENTATTSGGGVYNRSTFTMNDGSISKNTATTNGGGVFNYSTFNMNGGIISENEAASNGGGVYINDNSSYIFTMSGGSITNNKSNNQGGGVWISRNATFTKANNNGNSGIINSNTATIANGQQVFWNSLTNRYRNDPLYETDELSTTNTSAGWSQ